MANVRYWPKADIILTTEGGFRLETSNNSLIMTAYDPKRTI